MGSREGWGGGRGVGGGGDVGEGEERGRRGAKPGDGACGHR